MKKIIENQVYSRKEIPIVEIRLFTMIQIDSSKPDYMSQKCSLKATWHDKDCVWQYKLCQWLLDPTRCDSLLLKVLFESWARNSTFLIASSCLCLFSLAVWSCFILSARSSSSACCLWRSSLRLSRASRWGDGSPNLSSWMHVWIAATRRSKRAAHWFTATTIWL